MKTLSLKTQYIMALDISTMALHWAATTWTPIAPGVAAHIRALADSLAAKANALRAPEDETPPSGTETPTERVEVPEDVAKTEVVTQRYGTLPKDGS